MKNSYLASLSSIAKARTVLMLLNASSATAVAAATCSCAFVESFRSIDPSIDPTSTIPGTRISIIEVSLGDTKYNMPTQPMVWVTLLIPCEIHCLKALLKSWISAVNLKLKEHKFIISEIFEQHNKKSNIQIPKSIVWGNNHKCNYVFQKIGKARS